MKNEIIERIKVARGKRYLTNCYSMDVVEHSCKLWRLNDEFLFSYEDHGIKRLIYFVENWDSVDRLLEIVDSGKYYLEFMTKDTEEYKPLKSSLVAKMQRLANSDCSTVFDNGEVLQYKDSAKVEKAKTKDVEEINHILWTTFHTETGHLLSNEELKTKIEQFSIHKNSFGQIDALLQADVMPKKFYINQIVNKTQKNVIHAILLDRLEQYVNAGGKYLYAWVDAQNIASLKFHEKYKMRQDGVYSMIYSIER